MWQSFFPPKLLTNLRVGFGGSCLIQFFFVRNLFFYFGWMRLSGKLRYFYLVILIVGWHLSRLTPYMMIPEDPRPSVTMLQTPQC